MLLSTLRLASVVLNKLTMQRVIVVLTVLAVAAAEVAFYSNCNDVPEGTCQITGVQINPCIKKKKNICPVKQGTNTTLSFEYIPNFSSTSLKTMAYWANGDVPFSGLGSDNGCEYTPCPVESGKSQRFTYNIYIGKKLPNGIFQLKWKVWNEANEDEICCFMTTIKIGK